MVHILAVYYYFITNYDHASVNKVVNNIRISPRVEIMARLPKTDEVWNEIFESLILDTEPPIEYIKNVIITTKTGVRLKVSAIDFAQILERERFIHPEESDILSCRLAINFDKVRKDVNQWAENVLKHYDAIVEQQIPTKPVKRTRAKTVTSAKTADTKTKKTTKTSKTTKASKTTTKTVQRKPASKKTPK